jgi:hypothetical protein
MNYIIQAVGPFVYTTPPMKDYKTGKVVPEFIYVNRYEEPEDIQNEYHALMALYDGHQTNDVFKNGDTFTMKGKDKPFAEVRGVDIMPLYMLRGYKVD